MANTCEAMFAESRRESQREALLTFQEHFIYGEFAWQKNHLRECKVCKEIRENAVILSHL